jgi:hypothetical protein
MCFFTRVVQNLHSKQATKHKFTRFFLTVMILDHLDEFRSDEYSKFENLVLPSFCGLFLWISMVFVYSGDILKPMWPRDAVWCLFYSGFSSYWCFATGYYHTQSSAYPRIVHVSLISLTILAIAIKNRVTLKTMICTIPFLISFRSRKNFLLQLAAFGSKTYWKRCRV